MEVADAETRVIRATVLVAVLVTRSGGGRVRGNSAGGALAEVIQVRGLVIAGVSAKGCGSGSGTACGSGSGCRRGKQPYW